MDLRDKIRVGMVVRAGDGRRLGHVVALRDEGVEISGRLIAPWSDLIEVRAGALFVAAHRPGLSDRAQEAPRR